VKPAENGTVVVVMDWGRGGGEGGLCRRGVQISRRWNMNAGGSTLALIGTMRG